MKSTNPSLKIKSFKRLVKQKHELEKENHELKQVCLEVLTCLGNLDDPLKLKHSVNELSRVLFIPNDYLH